MLKQLKPATTDPSNLSSHIGIYFYHALNHLWACLWTCTGEKYVFISKDTQNHKECFFLSVGGAEISTFAKTYKVCHTALYGILYSQSFSKETYT